MSGKQFGQKKRSEVKYLSSLSLFLRDNYLIDIM